MKIMDLGLTEGGALHTIFDPWEPKVVKYDPDKDWDQLDDVDMVLFSGGTDVNPALYGHKNIASGCSDAVSKRDLLEQEVWKEANHRNVFRVGICRGNQFLCVMNRGWLIQDVNNHAGVNHVVHLHNDPNRNDIVTNSTHHQMVVPSKAALILGSTQNRVDRWKYDTGWMDKFKTPIWNPEIVLYSPWDLGFQFHPEYYDPEHEVPTLVRNYVSRNFRFGRD